MSARTFFNLLAVTIVLVSAVALIFGLVLYDLVRDISIAVLLSIGVVGFVSFTLQRTGKMEREGKISFFARAVFNLTALAIGAMIVYLGAQYFSRG